MIRRIEKRIWAAMSPLARYSGLYPGDRVVLYWREPLRTGRRGRPRIVEREEEISITRELLEEMRP